MGVPLPAVLLIHWRRPSRLQRDLGAHATFERRGRALGASYATRNGLGLRRVLPDTADSDAI